MSKLTIVIVLCSLLSACVIYTPTENVTYSTVVHSVTTSSVVNAPEKTITNEVSKRVVQEKHTSTQRSLADCKPFTLPRDVLKPKELKDEDLLGPRTLKAFDQLLVAKIKEYRTHVDSVHSKIEQAHQKWLESCQQKLLE
ncbi:hypothetical protein PHABIO_229 [Pseudomonas phage Phabio]|uniref:Lipoprotein n=1 Tax=Pseudomonas phage Phabio TaxID=2006668 RepID=A0A1Y0SU51_9CAUD|nr:hypothetical protein MZD05_gp229 [Pseudomonas phage Phabio]ARV76860.1 hypothetical protein PHABIO_229 [Pseudomonas phage Phabio]